MSYKCTFCTEYNGDYLTIDYSIEYGEMEINKLWLDGILIPQSEVWLELLEFAERAAFDDYVLHCEQEAEDRAVTAWESRCDAEEDTWQG